jgi:hypothetical protein
MLLEGVPGYPRPIDADERMNAMLSRIDVSTTLVQLAYDSIEHEVHIFLTPTDTSTGIPGVHVVYDIAGDSFWEDDYPLDHGPWGVLNTRGDTQAERRFIFGSNGGYILGHRNDINGDRNTDGTLETIAAYVRFTPISLLNGAVESLATELHADSPDASDAITAYWMATRKAASDLWGQAFPGSARRTLTLNATDGDLEVRRLRERGRFHQLVVSQTSSTETFRLEGDMTAILTPVGRVRGAAS